MASLAPGAVRARADGRLRLLADDRQQGLSALAANGLVTRRRRAGSVVAAPTTERAVLEIRDFALEAARAGRNYRFEILRRTIAPLEASTALRLGLPETTEMLAVATLHLMDEVPEAYELRRINLGAVPEVREERFATDPPGTWLLRRVPWTDAEHVVRAVAADPPLAEAASDRAGRGLPRPRTAHLAGRGARHQARITYPGDRHRLIGRFSPAGPGAANGAG